MKKIIFLFASLVVSQFCFADEIQISGTNTLQYGDGSQWVGNAKDVELKKRYIEDWFDLNVTKDNFELGLRFDVADPSSNDETFKRLDKRFFRYSDDTFSITAGNFYGIFGRGMVLNLREDKAEFFDNSVDGGKFTFENDYSSFQALGGRSYYKYLDDSDIEKSGNIIEELPNTILGFDGKFSISDYFEIEDYSIAIGASYLFMEGDSTISKTEYKNKPMYTDNYLNKTEITGINLYANAFDIDFYNEYALKSTFRDPLKKGWANYTSLSYAVKGFGVTLEYKDYYQFAANPNSNTSDFSPYQSPAKVVVDYTSHLLKDNPHVVSANDEIGYLLQLRGSVKGVELSLLGAIASKHDGDNIVPKFDNNLYLPYKDIWGDAKYSFTKFDLFLGGGYMLDTPISKNANAVVDYNNSSWNEDDVYVVERTTLMGEGNYKLNKSSSIKFCGEYQLVSKSLSGKSHDYDDIYASLEYTFPKYGYVNISVVSTTDEVPDGSPSQWIGYEIGANLSENHKLELFYGRERAGIKCSGGSCRQVPEFDGFKLKLVSTF